MLNKFPTKSFAYPVGEKNFVSEKNDWRDLSYNAQDFGENRHLGEDMNKTTGGNTDCGEPFFRWLMDRQLLPKRQAPVEETSL